MRDRLFLNYQYCLSMAKKANRPYDKANLESMVRAGWKISWNSKTDFIDMVPPPPLEGIEYENATHEFLIPNMLPEGRAHSQNFENWIEAPAWAINKDVAALIGEAIGQLCHVRGLRYIPDYRHPPQEAILTDCEGRTVYKNKSWGLLERETFINRACGGDRTIFIYADKGIFPYLSDSSYGFSYDILDNIRRLVIHEKAYSVVSFP